MLNRLMWKVRRIIMLIANGRYRSLLDGIYANMPAFLNRNKKSDKEKYSYLNSKYKSFIAARSSITLPPKSGGLSSDSEGIIWWLWLQGVDNAPELCKACLASLRRWHPEKRIITLDANNLFDYITFPEYIQDKYKHRKITHAHYSDLIRVQLLTEYGGTWIDSTVLCTGRKTEYIMHLPLFMYKWDSPLFAASSWFMSARPRNKIIMLTRDLLFEYWKEHDEVMHYFLIHMFLKMAADTYHDEWEQMPTLSNQPPFHMGDAKFDDYSDEKMKYFAGISDFHKLTYKIDTEHAPSPQSIYQHIINIYSQQ